MNWMIDLAPVIVAELALVSLLAAALLTAAGIGSLLAWRASAATRHLIWILAIVGCLALPLLRLVVPERPVTAVPATDTWFASSSTPSSAPAPPLIASGAAMPGPTEPAREQVPPTSSVPWTAVVLVVWLLGTAILLVRLVAAAVVLARRVSRALPVTDPHWQDAVAAAAAVAGLNPDRVHLCCSDHDHAPLVWGLGRPTVLLPAGADAWDDARRNQVLHHELAHLRRRDCLSQTVAAVATALYWFHPLVWFASWRMLVERERACDDHVLASGAVPADYAQHLLTMARDLPRQPLPANLGVAMARRAELSGRLLAILDAHRDRRAPRRSVAGIALVGMLLLTGWVASMTPAGALAASATGGLRAEEITATNGHDSAADWSVERIEQHIAAVNEAVEHAVHDGDVEAMLAPFSPDIELWATGGGELHGRRDLAEAFGELVANFRRLEIETIEVIRISDTVVYEYGTDLYTKGGNPERAWGRYLSIWRYEDGEWRIYRVLANS